MLINIQSLMNGVYNSSGILPRKIESKIMGLYLICDKYKPKYSPIVYQLISCIKWKKYLWWNYIKWY